MSTNVVTGELLAVERDVAELAALMMTNVTSGLVGAGPRALSPEARVRRLQEAAAYAVVAARLLVDTAERDTADLCTDLGLSHEALFGPPAVTVVNETADKPVAAGESEQAETKWGDLGMKLEPAEYLKRYPEGQHAHAAKAAVAVSKRS